MLQASIGYNDQRFFAGIYGTYRFIEHGAGNEVQFFDQVFFAGYRFKAPKKWIEKAEHINAKYGWGTANKNLN